METSLSNKTHIETKNQKKMKEENEKIKDEYDLFNIIYLL